MKSALLKLKPNSPEAHQAAGPAKITGFTPAAGKECDLLRKAANVAGGAGGKAMQVHAIDKVLYAGQ